MSATALWSGGDGFWVDTPKVIGLIAGIAAGYPSSDSALSLAAAGSGTRAWPDQAHLTWDLEVGA